MHPRICCLMSSPLVIFDCTKKGKVFGDECSLFSLFLGTAFVLIVENLLCYVELNVEH